MPLDLGPLGSTGIGSAYDSIRTTDAHRSPQVLVKLRGRVLAVSWAGAVFVATAGWLYTITVTGWSIVKWFVG
jgi:hypothetical protein